jgi:hypothetical protein
LAQTDPARERPHEGDLLVAVGTASPEPLKPDDFAARQQADFRMADGSDNQHNA